MADESTVSFEIARFEWVDPTRLELEGSWNGVTRRLARATLIIEVEGRRRRLRALPEDAGSPEAWQAAFGWKGGDIPRLDSAELEVGRGIVVDLPRPRSSKARAALPKEPIPATTRDDKEADRTSDALATARTDAEQARAAIKKLRDERDALRAERDSLRARAEEADALRAEVEGLRVRATEADELRLRAEQADALRAELEALRARADDADAVRPRAEEADALRAELEALRADADDADALRPRAEEADALRAELEALRADAEEADELRTEADVLRARAAEADDQRARAEDAEQELAALRAQGGKSEVAPDVARLRAELASVEQERTALRAQLDSTTERLEDATRGAAVAEKTQSMPPPRLAEGDDPRERLREARRFDRLATQGEVGTTPPRRTRRPAERTAKKAPEPTASLSDKVTDWVGAVIGTRDEDGEGSKNGERPEKTEAAVQPLPARRTRAVAARTPRSRRRESPSWALRVAAIGLLALLMIALILLLSSIL